MATHQGVLHEWVRVTYRAPSSYISLSTANRLSREWPPSTAIKLAIRPLLKASHMSENKGVWQSLRNIGALTISSRHAHSQKFWFTELRSQWPRCLKRGSAAARLLRLWVWIPPGEWMSVCCEWCVLSGTGLYDELITSTKESYRVLCVVVYDLETSWMRKPWPTGGLSRQKRTKFLLKPLVASWRWSFGFKIFRDSIKM